MARTTRELTDVQWAKLAPLLPPQRPKMGRPPKDHRLIVEAIVWLDRTGAPWRDLPSHFGPWETVASRFYRWRRRGVWDRVLARLQADADAQGELDWLLHFVDGSVVRAHQHAAGARRRPAKADLAAKHTGGSRRSSPCGRSGGAGPQPRWLLHQAAPSSRGSGQADGDPGHRRAAPRGADATQADGGRGGQAARPGPAQAAPGRGGW
jgi:transposase